MIRKGERFGEQLIERGKIGVLLKQPQPTDSPIEHMVRITTND
jgi:hypothetical protein